MTPGGPTVEALIDELALRRGGYLCNGCRHPENGTVILHGFADDGRRCINEPKETPMENEWLLQFFEYKHLPPHLASVSEPFSQLASKLMDLPRNAERTVALRKLLEAKDCAVRAKLAGES